jgi:energy-coupling factor transporter ATP-binding protein EcfA2
MARILDVVLESEQRGIKRSRLTRLGQVVLLAGPNGSGKSRALEVLQQSAPNALTSADRQRLVDQISQQQQAVDQFNERLRAPLQPERARQFETSLREHSHSLTNLTERLRAADAVRFAEPPGPTGFIKFVPQHLALVDPASQARAQLFNSLQQIQNLGFNEAQTTTLGTIQQVQDRWWNVTHQNAQNTSEERNAAVSEYEALCESIRLLLRASLGRDKDGRLTLDGRLLTGADLSQGQIVLFQFAVALHFQRAKLGDVILLLDEPENHLHTGLLLDVVDRLRLAIPNGQMWIATHSIHLLARFDPSSIWYVHQGRLTFGGKHSASVLESLMGGEAQIAELVDFMSLPGQYAIVRFAAQCLGAPAVAEYIPGDPQAQQIRDVLDELRERSSGSLRIVDFGAGRGRLLVELQQATEDVGRTFVSEIDYLAYEISSDHRDECIESIKKAYGTFGDRYCDSMDSLIAATSGKRADVVVLCNVLHEVSPEKWAALFAAIQKTVSPFGHLLVVEDQLLPIGETAHQYGYLVLDDAQIRSLFGISAADEGMKVSDARGDGRLKAFLVPAAHIAKVSSQTSLDAVRGLRATAKNRVKQMRTKCGHASSDGRVYAHWLAQWANSSLACEALEALVSS